MKKIVIFIFLLFSIYRFHSFSQTQNIIEIQPLFDYPVPPQEMESLEERCNYLVKNFWNSFDFKEKKPLDQYALNEAFKVYATAFQYASLKEVNLSVDKLNKALSGNPVLQLQFCKAAEENLYGPRANFWSDEIYIKFLEALIKNKKISAQRKSRYSKQLETIKASGIGSPAPTFWFTDKERGSKQYFPMSTPTLLIFGNPDDTDWRISRIHMDSNLKLTDALEKGKVNVLYILPEALENWQDIISNYNSRWIVGVSDEVRNKYDIRQNPSIFLVDSQGKIIEKNIMTDKAVERLLNLVAQ